MSSIFKHFIGRCDSELVELKIQLMFEKDQKEYWQAYCKLVISKYIEKIGISNICQCLEFKCKCQHWQCSNLNNNERLIENCVHEGIVCPGGKECWVINKETRIRLLGE